jgi:hypothetical protein
LIADRLGAIELTVRGCVDPAVWKRFEDEQLPPLDDAWISDMLAIEDAKRQAEEEEEGSQQDGWEAQAASLFGDNDEDE